jgi:glycosyltransferase involved in cell wall biosynthesis
MFSTKPQTPQITIVVPGRWHAFDLARELEQLGALHRIVTNYPRSCTRRWAIPDAKVVSLPLSLFVTKLAWKFGGERLAMRQQFRINNLFARRAVGKLGNPDVVHAWSGSAEPVLLAARTRRIPSVLERSSAHMLEQCRILREEYVALGLRWEETPRATVERELREYALVDRVFVPSLFVERSFISRGFPADRLLRNGFGVDLIRFKPGEKKDDVFRVIYAGSLSVRKGIHYLVRAFKEANVHNSELLLVGGLLPETDKLIGSADHRIRLLGHVPQDKLPEIYHSGSVFAMASVEEGQALVQAQALGCGLPLVCTTNTGGEDFLAMSGGAKPIDGGVVEFPAGYLVPVGNVPAMAGAFRYLAYNPSRFYAVRDAATHLAQRDLSWRRYAQANCDAYSQIVAQNN